jgi:hypothetical protein
MATEFTQACDRFARTLTEGTQIAGEPLRQTGDRASLGARIEHLGSRAPRPHRDRRSLIERASHGTWKFVVRASSRPSYDAIFDQQNAPTSLHR